MLPFLIFIGVLVVAFVVIWFLTPTTPRRPRALASAEGSGQSTWPWFLVTVAGTTMLLFVPTIFTAPDSPIRPSPLNLYAGGLGVSMFVAIGALSARSARRWPALIIMAGVLPLMLLVVHPPAHDTPWFPRTRDVFLLSMIFVMFFTSAYAFVHPRR